MRPLFQSSLDRRGKVAGRWTAAGVLMVGIHIGGGAAGFVHWGERPTELVLPPPTVIAFELAPQPVAPPPPQKIEEPVPEIDPVLEPPPPISELDLIPPVPPEVKVAVAVPEKKKEKKKKKKEEKKKKKIEKKPEPQQPPQDFKTASDAPSETKVEVPPQPVQAAAPVAAGPTPDDLARISNAKNQWAAIFDKHIRKYKKYPKTAKRKNLQGSPLVEFIFDREGNVLDARIARSSGVDSLDEEALKTFQRASPIPAPPPEIEGSTISMMLQIDFTLKK